MSMTNDAELITLDAWFGSTVLGPSNWSIGLFITAPGEGGGGTEVSGNNYSRITVANNPTNFPAATSEGGVGTKKIATELESDVSSGAWGEVAALGFFAGSDMRFYALIDQADRQDINGSNQQWVMPADGVTITAD